MENTKHQSHSLKIFGDLLQLLSKWGDLYDIEKPPDIPHK